MDGVASMSQAGAADRFRGILSDVLPNLFDDVDGWGKKDKVKQALIDISQNYKTSLSKTLKRSDWDDAANRCAYVFQYLVQHCNLVYYSLQSSGVLASWSDLKELKVCSIGGGPGSDLVGLATFLQHVYDIPPMLDCLVLDLYPNWKRAWDTIARYLPGEMRVHYNRCDLVRDAGLQLSDRQFVQDADIITLVKSFSAMSAFFRADRSQGKVLHTILREIKPGCHVLFIDNYYDGDTQFQNNFAIAAGLEIVFKENGKQILPPGTYSDTVQNYCNALGRTPMRCCDVNIQLYRKKGAMSDEIPPPGIAPDHPSSNGLPKQAVQTVVSGIKHNPNPHQRRGSRRVNKNKCETRRRCETRLALKTRNEAKPLRTSTRARRLPVKFKDYVIYKA